MALFTEIPKSIVAGDAYTFDISIPDYPSTSGYSGVLYLRGTNVVRIDGTASGNLYRFTLASSISEKLSEGIYEYSIAVTNGAGDRTTVATGMVSVKADFAQAGARISHIEKVLQAIEAVIEGRIPKDWESYSIAGRNVTAIPIMELIELRALYTKQLWTLRGNKTTSVRTVRLRFPGVR